MLKTVLTAKLAELEHSGLYRRLHSISGEQDSTVTLDGHEVLLLSSNNYLGLANHPALKHAAREAIEHYGCGAGASRLISGNMTLQQELEQRIAAFKKTEAALVFPSGYHANIGIISSLMGPGDTILSDALNHASIIDGCRLSRAHVRVFRHCDMTHLAQLLAECPQSGQRLIVTDSVFSMDGDVAPLIDIVTLARRYNAWMMVDEAHATGVFGAHGAGIVEEFGLLHEVEIHMGTLGKALGGFGAYVAGSRELIAWLINRARSFIYTTGIPPAVAASALAALDLVDHEPERRQQLWRNAAFLQHGLEKLGYKLGPTQSPILPVIIGDARPTMALAEALLRRGVFAHGIRPPTVPEGTSRLRVTPMATHSHEQLTRALAAFAAAGKELGILA
ncbi:MAG: 8-amino-7-oxononanoate synthase [Candidatus Binatia bacterium]